MTVRAIFCRLTNHRFAIKTGRCSMAIDWNDESRWFMTTWECECGVTFITTQHPTPAEWPVVEAERCLGLVKLRCPLNADACNAHVDGLGEETAIG